MTRYLIRPLLLFLSFAFAVISSGVGINSLVKSNDDKKFVTSHAPAGVSVSIDTQDLLSSGTVLTVATGLLALTSLFTIACPALYRTPPTTTGKSFPPEQSRFFLIASLGHLFFTLWIFATLIPVDVFARNRSAHVSASLGGTPLPDSLVKAQEKALGASPVYWNHLYIRLLAILPWFAFLFGLLTGIELFMTSAGTGLSDAAAAGADDEKV